MTGNPTIRYLIFLLTEKTLLPKNRLMPKTKRVVQIRYEAMPKPWRMNISEIKAPNVPSRFSTLISLASNMRKLNLSWSCPQVNKYDVNATKNKNASSSNILPAILWVRSSLSNCFTSTVSSFSCFNCSVSAALGLVDFNLLAIGNKDIEIHYSNAL